MISKESILALKNNRMLSDDIINALQNMLNREYPDVKDMQGPVLGEALQFKVINESPFVQVLHTGGFHWISISTFGCNNGEVCIMDSLFHGRQSQQTKRQICSLMNCKKPKIVVNALLLQQQNNGVDCGLFAIVFVQFVMHYKKYPINITFKQSLMRNHAMEALEKNKLELFPVIKGMPIEPVRECKRKSFELEIYCYCRMI